MAQNQNRRIGVILALAILASLLLGIIGGGIAGGIAGYTMAGLRSPAKQSPAVLAGSSAQEGAGKQRRY
jgi:hypothetical protein